jgi:uncharacterized repeat protein (TIGR01451 family)
MRYVSSAVLWLTLCYAAVTLSAGLSKLSVTTVAEVRQRVERQPGVFVDELVPATRLVQGQEIFYTVSVLNRGAAEALGVTVTKKIPSNTRYVQGSAVGPGVVVTFSADDGKTFAAAKKLKITTADGRSRPAAVDDYTHIRWQLQHPLAPQATAFTRFRAVFK